MTEEVEIEEQGGGDDPLPLPKGFTAVKKGGGEIPLPNGFEPIKKKDFFNQDPHSYLKLFGGTSSPSESQSQGEVNPNELPSTSNLKIGATDARVGGDVFNEAPKSAKVIGGIYNSLVGSAARLVGGIGEFGQDFDNAITKQMNKEHGRPENEGILPRGTYRKENVELVEKLRLPVSTKENEAKLSEFDIHKKSLGENIKALAFTAPSMVADVMAGTASGGATFFAQGVNDAAEEIESNPATKDLPENLKLGYTYTSGIVNSALMKFNFDQIFKGTGVDKFITKNITNKVIGEFVEQGIKATKEDIAKAVTKEAATLSSNIQRFGLNTAVSALTGAGTGAAMEASHKGLQALVNAQQGKEVFDTENIGKDIANSAANLGLFSALTGGASSLKRNLDYVNKVKENVAHLPEEHQVAYVKESLTEKLANEKAEKLTDPTLIKNQKEIAKEAHEIKTEILKGKNPEEIVTTEQQKKIDEEEKRKTDLQRLQEDFELENKKFDEQRKGLDGRTPEDRPKIEQLELKQKRAKEDFEKAQAKLQPKEEKVESPSPVNDFESKKSDIEKRRQEDLGHGIFESGYGNKEGGKYKYVGGNDVLGATHEEVRQKINADYDAELSELEKQKPKSPSPVPEGGAVAKAEDRVSDIEKRRQEELSIAKEIRNFNLQDQSKENAIKGYSLLEQGSKIMGSTLGTVDMINQTDLSRKLENIINDKYDRELAAESKSPKQQQKSVPEGGGEVKGEVKQPMEDRELEQTVGRDVFKQIQRAESQLGEGIVDRNRMIETAKRIQEADKKNKLLPEHIFEALQYETGYPDNWQDLRNVIKKGGIDINSDAVQRQIEVGVKLPKGIVEEFKKSERYKNANPELVKATESLLGETKTTTNEKQTIPKGDTENKQSQQQAETTSESTEQVIENKQGAAEPPKEPPKAEVVEGDGEKPPPKNKALATRLVESKNIPEEARKGIEQKGLKYEPKSQAEAEQVAKEVIDDLGIDEAVLQAQAQKFGGDVNTLIQTESLNRLYDLSEKETNLELKLEHDKKFAEIATHLDEWLRDKAGRGVAAVNFFYKKSPLGMQMVENAKRAEDFETWAKPKEKSWKEFFGELKKDPEFEKLYKEEVKEELKKERQEARKERIKKVDKFFDDAKKNFGDKGAVYSTIIPPKVIKIALDGMQKAYHAGEKVAELIEKAVDYISTELGGASWDKDKFRKEWNEKLKDKTEKKPLTDEELKARVLEKFKNKLKGLDDNQKDDLIRRSFKKLVENGALEYDEFRKIIADVTGRGEMTDAEATRFKELVKKINEVEDAAKKAREERTPEALKKFRDAEVEAGKATRELNEIIWNKPDIIKRITSIMQLNTLGVPSLINNPIYNIINQSSVRYPVGLMNSLVDRAIAGIQKARGKDYNREYNTSLAIQGEFFKKLGFGAKEAGKQFLTGLNRQDYIQKELVGQQIRPFRSLKDLLNAARGKKNLTTRQVIDKALQGTVGIPAEAVARALNVGDKPQRFAAEGAQGAAFAKALGLKGMDYKLFMEFPREEAYRAYKAKGLSDAEAGKKADYIKEVIIKEGERSTFQQDNLLNDLLTRAFGVFGGKDSGGANLLKSVTISPFIKIPANAFWSYYNLVNPEVAVLQSFIHGARAAKLRSKGDNSSALALREARYWLAHGIAGIAMRGVIGTLVANGIYTPSNEGDDTKKEREGEANYEPQGTINITKLWALMSGEDPSKVKNSVTINNKWFGQWGTVGNTIARKYEEMTPEQREKQQEYWNIMLGGLEVDALKDVQQGIFGNTSSLLGAINNGGRFWNQWGMNTTNMFANIGHPATMAQISRAQLPYYSTTKAESFSKELKNSMLTRSSWLRNLSGQYPPSKVNIWGEQMMKPGNTIERLFGINQINNDNFAQPLYEDAKKTGDISFFPPAVMPEVNNKKLTPIQQRELEVFVGAARKDLIAPYINDMATVTGYDKPYSELNHEEKTRALSIIYELGYNEGKRKFILQHPEFAAKEKDETDEEKEDKRKEFRTEVKDKLPEQ